MLCERVHIAARVRPPLDAGGDTAGAVRGVRVLAQPASASVVLLPAAPALDRRDDTQHHHHQHLPPGSRRFCYDAVHGPSATQAEVYRVSAAAAVLDALAGTNAVVLAYGPSGAGKTWTCFGPHTDAGRVTADDARLLGLIPRAVHDLFERLAARAGGPWSYSVGVQYLQDPVAVLADVAQKIQILPH